MPSFPLPQGPSREADHISIYSADADGSDDSEADATGEDDIDECEEVRVESRRSCRVEL